MTGLYIHIPFCHSKCIYCDFYSKPQLEDVDCVVDGIIAEYRQRVAETGDEFDTCYLGGGTPSVLSSEQLARLVAALPCGFKEFTIEVNPEDVNAAAVSCWKDLGINRVSMGVQSLDDGILKWMRRRHSATDALNAISALRCGGIENISCDLIYGVPRLTDDMWELSLRRLLSMDIDHLSAYCLTYHDGTALKLRFEKGMDPVPEDSDIERQFALLREITSEYGFEHYEISNFARSGRRSKHNSIYWSPDGRWLGLGPSAHSFDGNTRRIDFPDNRKWLEHIPCPFFVEEETELDRINDYIVTGLRTADGLALDSLGRQVASEVLEDARRFIRTGKMQLNGARLSIAPEHWLISDSFIRELIRL